MNILVQRVGALGDVLNATPVVKRLHEEYPDAIIDVSTAKVEAFRGNPYINSACFGRPPDKQYQKIIMLDMAYESNRKVNQTDAYMLVAFGDVNGDKTLYVNHLMSRPRIMQDMDVDWANLITIHPNTSWPSRTMPLTWWSDVVDTLIGSGHEVAITGTSIDADLDGRSGMYDMRDKLSLADQASLIENSSAVLCGPSGIASLAACTETPIVILCNITKAEYTVHYRHGKLGWNTWPVRTPLDCYGCQGDEPPSTTYACKRKDNACVTSFDVGVVARTIYDAEFNDERHRGIYSKE